MAFISGSEKLLFGRDIPLTLLLCTGSLPWQLPPDPTGKYISGKAVGLALPKAAAKKGA